MQQTDKDTIWRQDHRHFSSMEEGYGNELSQTVRMVSPELTGISGSDLRLSIPRHSCSCSSGLSLTLPSAPAPLTLASSSLHCCRCCSCSSGERAAKASATPESVEGDRLAISEAAARQIQGTQVRIRRQRSHTYRSTHRLDTEIRG